MTEDKDDLEPGQLREHLPQPKLPPELRGRVIESFASRPAPAMIRARAALPMALAAAMVFFVIGFSVGRRGPAPGPASTMPSFAFLLYDGESASAAIDGVAEHIEWARGQAAIGRRVSGEKLGDASVDLSPLGAPAITPVRGFFIVPATNLEEATSIARSLPHLKNGGRIVVRPIDPT